MKNFEGFMEEVAKFLEQTEEILSEITKGAEPEKKGVSWDELSGWVAESEGVQEFEEDSDTEQPVYVTKDTDLHSTCANCEQCQDCGECGCDEHFNHDDYADYDEFWEWIEEEREQDDEWDASAEDSDCNEQESGPTRKGISLLDYKEALFRHVEKMNPEHRPEAHLILTEAFSNVIWGVLEGPNTVTPEEISTAHKAVLNSKYLLASVKSQLNYPDLQIDLLGAEAEIESYLKEKN